MSLLARTFGALVPALRTGGSFATAAYVAPGVLSASRHMSNGKKKAPMDGNTCAAHVAYAMSDMAVLYPITPSSAMGEYADAWAATGRKNIYGNVLSISQMQSEAGAAGAIHGALTGGALTTTFTCSQGLLLMMPNMYKIAGELLPAVFHVSARAVAGYALSIYGDHNDVMGVRPAGFAQLVSSSMQEVMDLAAVAHMSTLKAKIPFIHFFDGFRTSHEINTVEPLSNDVLRSLVDMDAVADFKARALNNEHPCMHGAAVTPDVFFQCMETSNPYYAAVPGHVIKSMEDFGKATGRHYKIFEYSGDENAEHVVVVMGSGARVLQSVCRQLTAAGQKVGVLNVHLYRPWSREHFMAALPPTVKTITVMDRCKEAGASGEPLYLDVVETLQNKGINILNGRFGLGSKEFTPGMAFSVFENAKEGGAKKKNFTVGIVDDVTNTNLPLPASEPELLPAGTTECMFWGLGSDGTVGANKSAIRTIVEDSGNYGQGYFSMDAKKSGGVTISHLRFGPSPIDAPYLCLNTNYVGVHNPAYLTRFGVTLIKSMKPGGMLVINSKWNTASELAQHMPNSLKKAIADKKIRVYNVDASKVAVKSGLPSKLINNIMQTAFYKLSEVIPVDQAIALTKKAIEKEYARKGAAVIKANKAAVDNAVSGIVAIDYPAAEWAALEPEAPAALPEGITKFATDVLMPMAALKGDSLPVSRFPHGGVVPMGMSQFEKRGLAEKVPRWNGDNCTQCNECVTVCPHGCLLATLCTPAEEKAGKGVFGATWKSKKAKGGKGLNFRIQVSPYDCTGCEMCARACNDEALSMVPFATEKVQEQKSFNWAMKLPERDGLKGNKADRYTAKGSQFYPALLQFSGSCAGCAQSAYVRILTQLFGESMVIANATGCSSIWGGSYPCNPYRANQKGKGPAWGNSLFEDNAEYGYGMARAHNMRRDALLSKVKAALKSESLPADLKEPLSQWTKAFGDRAKSFELAQVIAGRLESVPAEARTGLLKDLYNERDMFSKKCQWIVGGDGWAYDIGYGGLDHVLASGEDVKVLVLDTEVYSNTGGQKSKSTNRAAVAKFAAAGKDTEKKDLGLIAMTYDNVYVASVCLQADRNQMIRAMTEAEKHKGPAIVIAYCPCIEQGVKEGMAASKKEMKLAVESGYHLLYRSNPALRAQGKNPLQIDAKPNPKLVSELLKRENRFTALLDSHPQLAKSKQKQLKEDLIMRYNKFARMAGEPLLKA